MTKLLAIDLRSSVPGPIATPMMTDRLYEVRLNTGQTQAHQWEPVHVKLEDDRDSPPGLTDMMRTVPFGMVSKRFRDLLDSFDCACEFLPLVVHYNGRSIEDEYFALNVLHVSSGAMDVERSELEYYDAEFQMAEGVRKLVLHHEMLNTSPMAFIDEIGQISVNEPLAQAIADAGLIGVHLMKPEEFRS